MLHFVFSQQCAPSGYSAIALLEPPIPRLFHVPGSAFGRRSSGQCGPPDMQPSRARLARRPAPGAAAQQPNINIGGAPPRAIIFLNLHDECWAVEGRRGEARRGEARRGEEGGDGTREKRRRGKDDSRQAEA